MSNPVWGLDVSTKAVSFGVLGVDHLCFAWRTATRDPKAPFPRYLHELSVVTSQAMLELWGDYGKPLAISIEQPIGPHPNPRLMAAWGVVCTQAVAMFPDTLIWTPKPKEWRQHLGLKGNASKADLAASACERYAYTGDSEDEAEALLIADALRVLYRKQVPAQ